MRHSNCHNTDWNLFLANHNISPGTSAASVFRRFYFWSDNNNNNNKEFFKIQNKAPTSSYGFLYYFLSNARVDQLHVYIDANEQRYILLIKQNDKSD